MFEFYDLIRWVGGLKYATFYLTLACFFLLLLQFIIQATRSIRRLKARRKESKRQLLQAKRQLEFALPDSENQYLRERLHTALRKEEKGDTDKGNAQVRLRYARKLLACLKESPLSPVERLDVEEICALVAAYGERQRLSGADIKAVNEVFARILKLSAKYEIAV